ncbi:hypothetical protein OAD66_00205 [Bacteroidia bacterium]|nr:hypothetical protein [Bacteroidia bacterium]
MITSLFFFVFETKAQIDTTEFASHFVADTVYYHTNTVRDLELKHVDMVVPKFWYTWFCCSRRCNDAELCKSRFMRVGYAPKWQDSTHKLQVGLVKFLKGDKYMIQTILQSNLKDEYDFSIGTKIKVASLHHKKIVEIPVSRVGLDIGVSKRSVFSTYVYPNINLIFPNGRWSLEGGYMLIMTMCQMWM